jgi:hypothetical protein
MKKVLLACLLGLGTLLPANEAKSSSAVQHRIISIHIEDYWLRANSEPASGIIQSIQIFNVNTEVLVQSENCDGYSCSTNISGLKAGVYSAVVITTKTVYKKQFSVN